MRLMTAEKGAETPMEKYVRYKNNLSLWYQENCLILFNQGLDLKNQKAMTYFSHIQI